VLRWTSGKLYQEPFIAELSILLGSTTIFPWKKVILSMYTKENRGKCKHEKAQTYISCSSSGWLVSIGSGGMFHFINATCHIYMVHCHWIQTTCSAPLVPLSRNPQFVCLKYCWVQLGKAHFAIAHQHTWNCCAATIEQRPLISQ
jgi:hypothetical protein